MMRESTWRAASVWQGLCGLVGVVLLVAGIVSQKMQIVVLGLVLVGFAVLLRWVWNKVPTATDDEINRMG